MRFFSAVYFLALGTLASPPAIAANSAPPPPTDLTADGNALVRIWVAPRLPPGIFLKAHEEQAVQLRCVIDEHGQVTSARILKSSDPRLDASALAAIRVWRFAPAVRGGKPVASCLDLPMIFSGGAAKHHDPAPPHFFEFRSAPFVEAKIELSPEADYPASLVDRGLPGQVVLAWVVTPEGRVSDPRVLEATHADFVLPALASLARWEFAPAHQGDLTVPSEMQGAVDFEQPNLNRGELLKANEITAPDGFAPADVPYLKRAPDPVWPYALLLEGSAGEATAEFSVTNTGRVENVRVRSASRPEFGRSLAAALATWQFQPAIRDERVVEVPLLKHAAFAAVPVDAAEDDPWTSLVRAARARKISSAAGLDSRLAPVFRVSPQYPPALRAAGGPAGSALLEIVIARDGRVRLTRIVSATRDDFGWAAATAFSQWIFAPPLRGSQAVDVSVQVPVNFPAVGP